MKDWKYVKPKRFQKAFKMRNKVLRQFLEHFATLNRASDKLIALKEIAEMEFLETDSERLEERRAKFNKHKVWKLSLATTCFVCGKPAKVRHHIIQLQKGGTNGHHNLIPLCNSCHEEIHPWMKNLPRPKAPFREPLEPPTQAEPPDGPEEPPEDAWNLGKYTANGYSLPDVEREEFYR